MSLRKRITDEMTAAMKARQSDRVGALRYLLSELKNDEIDKRRSLTEEEEITLLDRQAKKRRESIEVYEKHGREDLAAKERFELDIIQTYLPKALTPDEARAILQAAVDQVGAKEQKDIGAVMKLAMPQLKGRFPGKDVQPLLQAILAKR